MGGTVASIHSATTADVDVTDYAIGYAAYAKSQGYDWLGIAKYIMEQFDNIYGISWHCFVGEPGYASYTECEAGSKIRFTMEGLDIILFKHTSVCEPKPSRSHYPSISSLDREFITKSKMDPEMESHAFDCCRRACAWYTSNTERARFIGAEFDKEHNGGWNCVVGNAAYSVHDDHECYISLEHFGQDDASILLYRC